jgi:DNA topoisomerase-1
VSVEFVSPCGSLLLRCAGSSLASPGWLAAWADWSKATAATDAAAAAAAGEGEGGDDGAATDDDDLLAVTGGGGAGSKAGKAALSQLLQQLQEGQQVLLAAVLPGQHFTKPPPRYTEASMVKTLEEAGVGRPSTYAPIIRKLLVRPFVYSSCALYLLHPCCLLLVAGPSTDAC